MTGEKLFDDNDLADWELHFESGRAALDLPTLKPVMPEFCRIAVLDQPVLNSDGEVLYPYPLVNQQAN